ncbi:MAG: class IV lanthionine synthetase LanL [Rubrobacter sp.]|nr:class IV lanthionine synthetase LanL [Rubrobacter sp.]
MTKKEGDDTSEQSERAHSRQDKEIAGYPDGGPVEGPIATVREDESDGSLLTLIMEACSDEPVRVAGWRIDPGEDAHRLDIRVRNEHVELPEQGWKLHVSADLSSAEAVLRCALPVLLSEDASFKVVSSLPQLAMLNEGMGGPSQIGKFITVYPKNDAQAVRLAVALDEITRGLRGPAIPSDRPLAPRSLVHYRYGGFGTKLIQAPSGEIQPAITAPNGELVPDRRSMSYHAPDWAVDPFVIAGVVAEPAETPSKVIGRRYLRVDTLYWSPKGAVYHALDLEVLRHCVLKRRCRGAGAAGDGRDARDYLRNEAEVLGRLAPDPRFPEAFELIEREDGDLLLAMEEVKGETLGEHVANLAQQGRHVSGEGVVAWGQELAAMLRTIHDEGFVYRDLKMENVVITPDGCLRLLDFELACELGAENPLSGVGTRGYFSPQRAAGEPPAVTDDVYSLGALLYATITSAAVPLAPHPRALLKRPIELLNPAAGPALIEVISRCLEPDPAARFPSMSALGAALANVGAGASVRPAMFGGERAVEPEAQARGRYRELAKRLGDTLCKEACRTPDGRGLMWRSKSLGPGGMPLRDLCIGGAGAVLALAELVGELDDPEHRSALAEGTRWLKGAPRLEGQPLPGLYVGEAGVGAALLRAGQILSDGELIDVAAERGRWISSLPYASPDMFNGTAGCLRFHLLLWDEAGDPEHLSHAIAAGEFLLERTEDAGDGGLRWMTPPDIGGPSSLAYLGYAHGAAGIADALLDLFEATADERFLSAARGAGQWLARLAIPVLDDDSGLDWPHVEGRPPAGAAWCHGATGIGRFFLHAAEFDVLPEAAEIAARAARTVARGARTQGPTQCHGLAGNTEFLLDMAQATGDRAYLAEAWTLARLMEAFSTEKEGALVWPSDPPDVFSPDYMTGFAGVAMCLLRLSDPGGLPHQLSRSGFRHR